MKFDQIVLISLDTLRSDCINCNPQKLWPNKYKDISFNLKTNIIDDIATKGLFFTNCIASAPYTSASHASIFTGKWPLKHGVYEFYNKKLQSKTLFSVAKHLGYNTTFKVDFPIILGKHLGFTKDVNNYIVENDQEFIDSYNVNIPNFSFVHFGGLHIPYGFHNLFYGGDNYIQKVEQLEDEIKGYQNELADQMIETYRSQAGLELLLRYKRIVQYYYSHKEYSKLFKMYLEGINHFCNTRFEMFFEQLINILEDKKYLIVIFADHGEEYDENAYGHHNALAEGVIRVPAIFYHKGIQPKMIHNRVRTIDIAPTLFDIMGFNLKKYLKHDGEVLTPIINNKQTKRLNKVFSQTHVSESEPFVKCQKRMLKTDKKTGFIRHYKLKEAVYVDNYKLTKQDYICTREGGIGGFKRCEPIIKLETFDEDNNPRIVSDNSDKVTQLISELKRYNRIKKHNKTNVDITDDIKKQLINLGYLTSDTK